MDALVEAGWKAALVLVLGFALAAAARRASAATRHLIWTAALGGALLLPLLSAALPGIPIAGMPSLSAASPEAASTPDVLALSSELPDTGRAAGALASRASVIDAAEALVAGRPATPAPPAAARAREARTDWPRVAQLLWATVAMALFLRIVAGDLQLRAIARRARRAVDREWIALARELEEKFDLRRGVELLESDETEVPVTWGSLHPRIVLPTGASGWPLSKKRAVLIHELAHVQRHDAATQLLARLACALHWPNPLAWLAARAMRSERERACDDRVLQEGARPSDYAANLLEVARSALHPGGTSAALAMARRSQLEGRLLAVLDPAVDRRPLNAQRAIAAACAAGCLVLPLAAVRADPEQSSIASPSLARIASSSTPAPPSPPSPPSPPGAGGFHLHSSSSGGSSVSTMSWSDDHRSADFIIRGEVRWNDDATDLLSLSSGGSLQVSVQEGGHLTHVEILSGPKGLQRTLLVDGAPRAWDAAWFGAFLKDLDRHTGFAAEARFPRLYREHGARGVLEEAAKVESDHARGRYLKMLCEKDPLDEPIAVAVLQQAENISGDYERSQVLMAVAAKAHLATDAERQAFLRACAGVKGDYEHARVLHALVDQPKLSGELSRAALASASTIGGDYEKSGVLVALAGRHAPEARDYLKATSTLSGSYEHARALKALIAGERLDGTAQVELIRQAAQLGDYECTEVLVELTRRETLTGEALREYEASAKRLGEFSRNRALAALHR